MYAGKIIQRVKTARDTNTKKRGKEERRKVKNRILLQSLSNNIHWAIVLLSTLSTKYRKRSGKRKEESQENQAQSGTTVLWALSFLL